MTSSSAISLCSAETDDEVAAVKTLFLDYAAFLGGDLCVQNFDKEMRAFPAFYARLLLAKMDGSSAGAVGLRDLGNGLCEMKRLYVHADYKGLGIGRRLCHEALCAAASLGFGAMCLGTLPRFTAAIALYEDLGFSETPPYADNPEPGVIYMSRSLALSLT